MLKKKVILFLGAFVLMTSLCACGQEGASDGQTPASGSNTSSEKKENMLETSGGEVEIGYTIRNYSWVPGSQSNSGNDTYYANVPEEYSDLYSLESFDYSGGEENHLILFGRQYDSEDASFKLDNAEDVISTYEEKILDFLNRYNRRRYDHDFEVTSSEPITINNIEMCKYDGHYNFTYQEKKDATPEYTELVFTAYSAPLSNGAYTFWISFAPDKAHADAAAECVAKTFRETEELILE